MKVLILAAYALSILYVHFRGRVRHKLSRQLSDHSSFLAPINCLMYLFSKVPNRPYLAPQTFPELQVLVDNWQAIRSEALHLHDAGNIKRSEQYDDIGFNSFFKSGWKRFYLKWYDEAHPSAGQLCPQTTALLRQIPSVKAAMFAELPPGSKLVRHRDPYAGSLRFHLGLFTPTTRPASSRWTASATTGATARRWCSMKPSSTTRKTPPNTTASFSSATSSGR